MSFLKTLTDEESQRYFHIVTEVVKLRTHLDLFIWMRGDIQYFMPHDLMVAAWGDFERGTFELDVISALPGVRTARTSTAMLAPLLKGLFKRWIGAERHSFALRVGEVGFLLPNEQQQDDVSRALQGMRVALVHGISNQRDRHDCLYAMFSKSSQHEATARRAIDVMLPYIDTALRKVAQLAPLSDPIRQRLSGVDLSHQPSIDAEQILLPQAGMPISERERQIMRWVEQGKTNSEIGTILDISVFTVKNHLQRIFKKLDVYNRAQAVSRFKDSNVT